MKSIVNPLLAHVSVSALLKRLSLSLLIVFWNLSMIEIINYQKCPSLLGAHIFAAVFIRELDSGLSKLIYLVLKFPKQTQQELPYSSAIMKAKGNGGHRAVQVVVLKPRGEFAFWVMSSLGGFSYGFFDLWIKSGLWLISLEDDALT